MTVTRYGIEIKSPVDRVEAIVTGYAETAGKPRVRVLLSNSWKDRPMAGELTLAEGLKQDDVPAGSKLIVDCDSNSRILRAHLDQRIVAANIPDDIKYIRNEGVIKLRGDEDMRQTK